jgi:hypothetical protein
MPQSPAICAGGVNSPPHQAVVTAQLTDPSDGAPVMQSGITITFSTTAGSVSPSSAVTDSTGQAKTTLTSNNMASESPTLYQATVTATTDANNSGTCLVEFQPTSVALTLNPTEMYIQDQAQLTTVVTWNQIPADSHNLDQYISQIWDTNGNLVYTGPGTVPSNYGGLSGASTQTDSNGQGTAVYQAGTDGALVEFTCADTSVQFVLSGDNPKDKEKEKVKKPEVQVDVNETAATDDDITLFNPGPKYPKAQTIKIKITNKGDKDKFDISVEAAAMGDLDMAQLNLDAGASGTVVFTPKQVSAKPNDVTIKVKAGGKDAGKGNLTVVSVLPPDNIRAASTPSKMKVDRIPPRVDSKFTFTVTPDLTGSGQKVTLATDGTSDDNGKYTIEGAATYDAVKTGDVNLKGTAQTAATAGDGGGNASKLFVLVKVRGEDTVKTPGFSVSSVPQNYKIAFNRLLKPATDDDNYGIVVDVTWESDSGVLDDLDKVEFSEQVQYGEGTGVFKGVKTDNSGYLPATETVTDMHSTPDTLVKADGGKIVADQAMIFLCTRTGVKDIPANKSGFRITREVYDSCCVWYLDTTKEPADVTVNGYSTKAGLGDKILKTQP